MFGGHNATIPCRFRYEPELSTPREVRVKWTWQPAGGRETEVLVAAGSHTRSSEKFGWVRTYVFGGCMIHFLIYSAPCCVLDRGRVHLRQEFPGDAALVIAEVTLSDMGRYRCEVVDGVEDKSVSVNLELYGDCSAPLLCFFIACFLHILLLIGV